MSHAEDDLIYWLRVIALGAEQVLEAAEADLVGHAADRIEQLEAAMRRIVESGAYPEAAIAAEAIALHPQIVVDVVKDGTIAYPPGHGPDDPPRPVQRHA